MNEHGPPTGRQAEAGSSPRRPKKSLSRTDRAIRRQAASARDALAQLVTGWRDGGVQSRDGTLVLVEPSKVRLASGDRHTCPTGSPSSSLFTTGAIAGVANEEATRGSMRRP